MLLFEMGDYTSRYGKYFSLQIIDCVKEVEEESLGRLEGFWQNKLATFEEHGAINRRDEMSVRRN